MKKKRIILAISVLSILLVAVAACLIWYHSSDSYSGAYEGMSIQEFHELIPKEQRFDYLYYSFYVNERGDPVVATCSTDLKTISKLHCCSKFTIHPTRSAAESITAGMSVEDVVSKLGTPVGSFSSGMITLAFDLADGSQCWVYFDSSSHMRATSVRFLDE